MNENPWHVDSVQAFAFLNCPECSFKTKEEDFFQSHAIASHPMCFVLFGGLWSFELGDKILKSRKYYKGEQI